MQKNISVIALLIAIASTSPHLTAKPLEFMSRNVRRLGDDPIEYQWDNRKQRLFDQILNKRPAIIGFQEVVIGKQFEDLKQGLPGYIAVGDTGRKAFATGWFQKRVVSLEKAKDESNPIFYDPKQVNLIADGTFGINPTGRFFNASLPRVCTWATFADKKSKKQFNVYNTHLSSSGAWGLKDGTELIRTKQIKMILRDIKKKKCSPMPVILMGDFNTRFEGSMKKKLTKAGFVHAKEMASVIKGPEATRTGWNDEQLKVIDHILIKGKASVSEYEVIESPKGQYPSDHRPVCALITIE
jgi:endonuclease/exonuclease/phosphatase family metal-dependent hydrolase